MWFAVVGLALVDLVQFGLLFILFSHRREQNEWLYGWISDFVKKHNSTVKRVGWLEERNEAWEKVMGMGTVDALGDIVVAPGVLQRAADDTRGSGRDAHSGQGSDYDAPTERGPVTYSFADDITTLTYPNTLRECCDDGGRIGCPPRSIIEELCQHLRSAS